MSKITLQPKWLVNKRCTRIMRHVRSLRKYFYKSDDGSTVYFFSGERNKQNISENNFHETCSISLKYSKFYLGKRVFYTSINCIHKAAFFYIGEPILILYLGILWFFLYQYSLWYLKNCSHIKNQYCN